MKKKILSTVLVLTMTGAILAGCGSSKQEETSNTEAASEEKNNTEDQKTSVEESVAEGTTDEQTTNEILDDTNITVFAAKSLNTVMEELISDYNKTQPNVNIVGSYDSSGTLMTQIEEGAACDVFFSAAQKQMNQL